MEMTEQFKSLGLPLLPISAAHGSGMSDLLDAIEERLPKEEEEDEQDEVVEADEKKGKGGKDQAAHKAAKRPVRVAIVGRPNVGKSSLLNRILGFERSIVSPIAGTTHDPVDQVWLKCSTLACCLC